MGLRLGERAARELQVWILKGKKDDMYRDMWVRAMDDAIGTVFKWHYPSSLLYVGELDRYSYFFGRLFSTFLNCALALLSALVISFPFFFLDFLFFACTCVVMCMPAVRGEPV